MPHDVTLIATISVGFVLAFVFGYLANRLRLPPLVGYLLAGVAIGSLMPNLVGDSAMTSQLAEIGVMLLMFGVGLHFSTADLMAVRLIAIPGAILQILIATAMGLGLATYWGWTLGAGLVLGLSLSVASTVVLLKALEERNGVGTPNGRIAIGWLIVEDLAMVLTLVLLPAFAGALGGQVPAEAHLGDETLLESLVQTMVKVTAFVMIVLFFGPKVLPWILRQVARTGSRELFTLCVLALSLGIAFGSAKLFDVSYALGAFFAGVVLSESDLSHKAAANSLPLQDAFAVLFFVSVGMVFNPAILIEQPLKVLSVLAIIMVGKSLIAMGIVLALGYPLSTGLTAAAALAQVGEFSFILAGLGITYKLLPAEGLSLVLAGSILSITLNPIFFSAADALGLRLRRSSRWKHLYEEGRGRPYARLLAELDAGRVLVEKKAEAHKTFTPSELVSHFPLFASLSPDDREVLLLHFESKRAQPGDRLIRAGDKADSVFFISSGEVEVVPRNASNKIKLGPGAFFGEMALITGEPRSADVTALDFCKFLTLSQRDFRRFIRKFPAMREQVEAMARERGAMNRKILEANGGEAPAAPVTG
ncbi:cation:proton antiporter domain-containing protein [Horticoccus sp. 23ND18S-11]|uniref:cation:proton antiporter domain-containing protein n=1 Tax=Horticoccus sp. 23ND18S-11 TaxID=3391832 RepID=UPI0039C8C2BD